MKKIDYSYQTKAANTIYSNVMSNQYIASVLAACPSAGKTTISHMIINKYVAANPNARVVVLTEGQNTLKSQYLSELTDANIQINFTYGEFNSEAQVRVGIPQSINNLDWSSIDLLIVDEAHNFYLEPMVQDIVKKLNPKHKVLMTGSPTKYNLHNQTNKNKYHMYYISAEELQGMGVFSPVDIDIIKTEKNIPEVAIADVISDAKSKGDNLSKIMVACPTIKYAKSVSKYLNSIGYKVAISTSENDSDNKNIDSFKAGEFNALVVVGKGILGFNDPMITMLADLRSSSNVDASYQLFARVLRKHPDGVRKSYYRISNDTKKSYVNEVLTCQKMIALMQRDVFVKYNGKNLEIEVVF